MKIKLVASVLLLVFLMPLICRIEVVAQEPYKDHKPESYGADVAEEPSPVVVNGCCSLGDCWVADNEGNKVVKLSADGSVIYQFDETDNKMMKEPVTLVVNPADGSCWVACTYENTVFKLSSQCEKELCLHGTEIHPANNGAVNPSSPCIDENGDCWLVLAWIKRFIKLDQSTGNGIVDVLDPDLADLEFPIAMAIDPINHKLWVAELNWLNGEGYVSRFSYTSTSCTFEDRWDGLSPVWVDVDPTNGYCWVADAGNNRVVKISPAGARSYFYGFNQPMCVSVDPNTHGCWVADTENNRVVRLSFSGTLECETSSGLSTPMAVEVDPTSGTCWVSDTRNDRVVKLGFNCDVLHERPGFNGPLGLALEYRSVCVQYTDVGSLSEPVVFSFAIITDNHIHVPPAYMHLKDVVDWINSNIQTRDIRFVMHLGDISDEGYRCRSEPFLGVKKVLDQLQVPYVPLIGNHDVWYDYPEDESEIWFEKRPEEIFNQVFSPQYDYLDNCVLPGWTKAPTPISGQPPNAPKAVDNYFQNFAFDYMRYHFICLDWVSRDDIYTSDESGSNRGWPDLQQWTADGTMDWFIEHICSYVASLNAENKENILLFAHHPLSFEAKLNSVLKYFFTFDPIQYSRFLCVFANLTLYPNVDKWFAGHWHYCDGLLPPCEETITDDEQNNNGNIILTNIETKSVTDFLNPEAPCLRIVRVHDDLKVDFNYSPSQPLVNTPISFTDLSTTSGTITNWNWDFGDGTGDSGQTPSPKSYSLPGVYKVTLTVTDNSGRKASIAKAVDVGTYTPTSEFSDATAFNNARKLIFDPANEALHLVYTTGPELDQPGPGTLTYSRSTDQGDTWFEVTPALLGGAHPAMDVDALGKPCIVGNWAGIGSGFNAKRREKPLGWFSYDPISSLTDAFRYPSMVVDSDGTLHIATSTNNNEIRYYKAILGGIVHGPEIVASAPDCQFASVALDTSEVPHVIWQQGSEIYHGYRLALNSWTASASPISSGLARTPSLVADGGALYAAWQEDNKVIYRSYTESWSDPEQVVTLSTGASAYPQVVNNRYVVWQDLNGGKYDIYYSKRITLGTWQTPTNISNKPNKDSRYPQATMGDNYLHVVWTEETPYEIRHEKILVGKADIAITNITLSKTIVGQGYLVSINATAENQGNYTQTFKVTAYANTTTIQAKTITLTSGNSTTITLTWNTTSVAKGNYTITAYAWPVLGETDTADNTLFADKCVCVSIPGDVDADFDVDLYDAVKLLVRYGVKKGHPKYDPNCDIDGDGNIDLYDAVRLLKHYGQKYP